MHRNGSCLFGLTICGDLLFWTYFLFIAYDTQHPWAPKVSDSFGLSFFRLKVSKDHRLHEFSNRHGVDLLITHMGVSKNMAKTLKSSILICFSIINHPFWGWKIPLFLGWHPYWAYHKNILRQRAYLESRMECQVRMNLECLDGGWCFGGWHHFHHHKPPQPGKMNEFPHTDIQLISFVGNRGIKHYLISIYIHHKRISSSFPGSNTNLMIFCKASLGWRFSPPLAWRESGYTRDKVCYCKILQVHV